jgi:hypothetical protein
MALATYPPTAERLVAFISPVTRAKLLCFPPTIAVLLASAATVSWRWSRARSRAPHVSR